MPTCDEYLGKAKGHCPDIRTSQTRFCGKHAAEREEFLPGSTTHLDYQKDS